MEAVDTHSAPQAPAHCLLRRPIPSIRSVVMRILTVRCLVRVLMHLLALLRFLTLDLEARRIRL